MAYAEVSSYPALEQLTLLYGDEKEINVSESMPGALLSLTSSHQVYVSYRVAQNPPGVCI